MQMEVSVKIGNKKLQLFRVVMIFKDTLDKIVMGLSRSHFEVKQCYYYLALL